MTVFKITIPGTLPGLNEIIKASKQGKGRYQPYSELKREYTNLCALVSKKLPKMERIRLKITYIEPHNRRDPDNIAVAKKFILDGLVRAGIIKNDGWKEIDGWEESFKVDKENPRIEIEIREV